MHVLLNKKYNYFCQAHTKKENDLPSDNAAELEFLDKVALVPLIALPAVGNIINDSVLLTTLRLITETTFVVDGLYLGDVLAVVANVSAKCIKQSKISLLKSNYNCTIIC